jgi:hypothetical protein
MRSTTGELVFNPLQAHKIVLFSTLYTRTQLLIQRVEPLGDACSL